MKHEWKTPKVPKAAEAIYYANRQADTAKAREKVAKTNAGSAAHGRATARRRAEDRAAEAARAATAELAKVWP
jgi:hypothetical protein